MFATWLLEADLLSTLRIRSHIMEYRQTQQGSARSNNTRKLAKQKRMGALTRGRDITIALGDFKCDQI